MIAKRAGWLGLVLAACAGIVLVLLDRPMSAFVLTFTAAVGIINSLWLENALTRILQPGRPRVSRGAALILLARLALWAVLFAVLFVLRDRVELWAVAAGIACFLVSLGLAGLKAEEGRPGEE
ncbi:MAG: hypothetical protein ACM3O7_11495 [Acidobacteriota bacterium]